MREQRILLVEDDEVDILAVQRLLRKNQAPVQLTVARDGLVALGILENLLFRGLPLPDKILLDLNMPRMNGLEFLRKLRQDSAFQELPVVVLTTSNDHREMQVVQQLDVSDYLVKSIGSATQQLETAILRHMLLQV